MAQAKIRIEDQNSLQAEPFEEGPPAAGLDLGPFRRALALVASGLTLAEGQARLDREGGRLRADRRRRRLERHRAVALRDGEDEPDWSAAELATLAEADVVEAMAARIQSVKGKPATAARSQAARMRMTVTRDRAGRASSLRDDLRLTQTIALDAVREGVAADQVLDIRRGQVTRRLKTRDGLVMLHESGALTTHQLAVGLRYRAWYELAQASLKSCLEVSDREHRQSTLWTQYRAASRRAAVANRVRAMEAAVSTRLHPDALLALRLIAGEARTVNSISTAARRRVRLAEGLALALTVVSDNLPEAR